MNDALRQLVWRQFGAAIDALEAAIRACPDSLWGDRSRRPEFWYVAFHTLFFLDYYSAKARDGFAPPAPFGLEEMDPEGVMPPRVYTREELLRYLEYGRERSREAIRRLTEESIEHPSPMSRSGLSEFELLVYGTRHVQHHSAQLNLMLRQAGIEPPRWVSVSREALDPIA